ALTSHGTKASARAAANLSPEPLSNWALSFGEDVLAVWLTWFATAHPAIAIIVVAALVVVSLFLLYHLFHFLRRTLRKFAEACAGPAALFQIRSHPIEERLVPKLCILRLHDPVALIGENHQFRSHALSLQRAEKF